VIPLLFTLKILHLAAVAVWVGGSLTAPRDVRMTLALGQPHLSQLMPRLRGTAELMNRSALATVVTGAALIAVAGGPMRVPHRIHLGLLLTLLAYAAGRWMIRPVLVQLAGLSKGPVTPDQAKQVYGKFATALNVEHALRIAVLVLMVYPFAF
jgi:hypothetical protein